MREAVGRVTLSAISIPRGFQAPAGPSHEQPALALLWARSGLETSQGTSQPELHHHPMITSVFKPRQLCMYSTLYLALSLNKVLWQQII